MLKSSPATLHLARHNQVQQTLHWLTALVIFTVLPLAWVMVHMGKEAHGRDLYFTAHKSFGLVALALIVARLVWRAIHRPPPMPVWLEKWETGLAHATHFLLYTIFIIMPVSGFILSSAGGHPVSFFGLFDFPQLPKNKELSEIADRIHIFGQYAVYAFLAAHILGVVWHVAYRRDGVLDRMLPKQVNAE
ncbi:MAG TPA: cytochrome b [Methylovirgula sp.]|nr:cytochrome b [Methylovirgula sp.]